MSAIGGVIERLLFYAAPVAVAAVLISPTGLQYILLGEWRILRITLIVLPIAGFIFLLIEFLNPRFASNRFAGVLLLWLTASIMITAVAGLISAAGDYTSGAAINATGHVLIPYNPTAGFLLAAFGLSMLVGNGLWGTIYPLLTPEFFVKASLITGLVLFVAVVGLVYGAIWLGGPACSGDCTGDEPASAGGIPNSSSASEPLSQADRRSRVTVVVGPDNIARPADGYTFVDPSNPADWTIRWTPGLPSRQHPHVVADAKEGHWMTEPGYVFANDLPGDYTVAWQPGQASPEYPHVVAGRNEGEWVPAAGYVWLVTPHRSDFRVRLADRSESTVSVASPSANSRNGSRVTPVIPANPPETPLDFILINRSPVPIVRILAKPTMSWQFGVPGASPAIDIYGQTYVAARDGQIEVRFLAKARNRNACFYDFLVTLQTGRPIRSNHVDICAVRAVVFDGYSINVLQRPG